MNPETLLPRLALFAALCLPSTASIAQNAMKVGTNLGAYGPVVTSPWKSTRPFSDEVYAANGTNLFAVKDPWNPNYINELAVYDLLRFLNWSAANDTLDSRWSERAQKGDNQETSGRNNEGCSIELMVSLCNRAGKDMWYNVPHQTVSAKGSGDYIRKFAILLKHGVDMKDIDLKALGDLSKVAREGFIDAGGVASCDPLKENLKVYVEYSNETWLGMFQQSEYCVQQGQAAGLGTGAVAGIKFHAWAACRMWADMEAVFGPNSPRVRKVDAFQPSGSQLQQHLEVLRDIKFNPSGVMPDVFSCNAYIGNKITDGSVDGVLEKLLQDMREVRVPKWSAVRKVVDQAKEQDGRKYIFYAYEGGQHLWKKNADAGNRLPGMYDVYRAWLDAADDYFDGVAHFQHGGKATTGGAWGAVEATTGSGYPLAQATYEKTLEASPKYRALVEYIKKSKP